MTPDNSHAPQAVLNAAGGANIAGVSVDTHAEKNAPTTAKAPFQPSMTRPTLIAQLSCEGCRAVQGMLDEIPVDYDTVFLEEHPELADRYQLEKVPALLIPDITSGTIQVIKQSEAIYQFICRMRSEQNTPSRSESDIQASSLPILHPSVYVTYQGKIGDAPKMVATLMNDGKWAPLPSPSVLRGKGTAFSEAILDLTQQLTDYIDALTLYRDQVLKTTLVYQQAILESADAEERM